MKHKITGELKIFLIEIKCFGEVESEPSVYDAYQNQTQYAKKTWDFIPTGEIIDGRRIMKVNENAKKPAPQVNIKYNAIYFMFILFSQLSIFLFFFYVFLKFN